MVMRSLFLILVAFLSVGLNSAHGDVREKVPELTVECRMQNTDFYARQPVPMVVTLKSSTPDIVSADVVSPLTLKKGEFASIQTVSPAGEPYEEIKNGRKYYCFPLEAYVVTMADKGSYEMTGGTYSIGVAYPVVVNDPFWGPRRTREIKRFEVTAENKKFRVRRLPDAPGGTEFSGSVGDFTIETVIPRGDIFVNEEATAIIVLKGKGMIAEATMPEYRDAFKNGMKLKSVSESRNAGYDRGDLISELQLECTFIPTERNGVKVGEITFDYFNPITGKYETARSKPVEINVKSTTSKRESMDI